VRPLRHLKPNKKSLRKWRIWVRYYHEIKSKKRKLKSKKVQKTLTELEAYYKMLSIMKIKNIISTICVLKCVINSLDIWKKSRKYRVKCRIEARTKCRSRKKS
jgi:hypothetical protein